jgi:autophagy-related protein 9
MSNDGKMEKSFVSFKAAHPEWMPADPSGSLYLERIAELSARRAADNQTPRAPPPNVSIPTTDRTWEYERALHESQTAAVRRQQRAGVGGGSSGLGFGTTSTTMLAHSTGTVYHSGMAQSVALGDSDGSIALAALQQPSSTSPEQQQHPHPTRTRAALSSSPTAAADTMMNSNASGGEEFAVDSEGEMRSALGESYVDGARRHGRGVGTRSMQEEEEEVGADGGVLGLLAQIYSGTAGAGARGVLS